jgi:uncharacterized repeat protein (TIGR04138 family)
MNETPHPILELLARDQRYKLEAYQFVRDGLAYAQEVLDMGTADIVPGEVTEPHLSGQDLCHAIRMHAIDQFGYMAKTVLNSWGICTTSDLGDIVYNLIEIGLMKKSKDDQREHFNDVFDFDVAFVKQFEITVPDEA